MTGIYDLGAFGSYLGIQGFSSSFFPSTSSVVFLDMVLVFFISSFLGIEWTIGPRSQLVFCILNFILS